jgi:hypothetical protein
MGIRHASADRVGLLLSDDRLEQCAVGECLSQSSDIVSTGHVVHYLIWTLLEHDASVSIIEHCIYHYRDHEGELTLSDPVQMTENLKKILRKHGVPEKQIPNIVQRHTRWYGRPIYSVIGAS